MPKKPSAYYRPQSLDEALKRLRQPGTVPLAGGTALLATEEGVDLALVDLQDLGLDRIEWANDGRELRLGAMVRLSELDAHLGALPAAEDAAALLRRAIRQAGPNTYRHAATMGGLVGSRLPDSELLAALVALDATLALRTPGPEALSLRAYLDCEERPPALITAVTVPWTAGRGHSERVARTPADSPIVSVTAWQPAGEPVRLTATGVSARPCRLDTAEAAVAGGLAESTVEAAGDAARAAASHPGDFRGDAAYRAEMAAVLTRRVLDALHAG